MKKVLLGFANNETFLVSEATADRVQRALPKNRYVTTSTVDIPDPDLLPRVGGSAQSKSVFDHVRRNDPGSSLTPKQEELARRFSKRLTSRPK